MSDFLERISKLSPKRLALLALELNEKLEAAQAQGREPIAVVGMGCRLPGGANDPEGFWRLLDEGRDAIRDVPKVRWDIDAYFDADPDAPGSVSARAGGFLDDIADFDADYFGISPREALTMDPQQRILLEVAIEALEHAGIAPDKLAGSATGVYVGICNSDYFQRVINRGEMAIDAYLASGSAHSVAAGRLSYCLGLQGPALAIDTACSSSLVALHQACAGLRSGSMRMAIAAGVNVLCTPETTIALSKAHMLAPDGRCKTFDASADGFARAEGCGVLILKRLADAEADGDRILAVIRGTASNQDGRSGGLTVPNGPAQEGVIRAALTDAGLGANDIDYVEAHGTGTSLGDPIEVRALAGALCSERPDGRPLLVGSVKTNLGHLESAAGVAGVIKVILALQKERLPRHLHFRTPSPHIAWSDYRLKVTAQDTPWRRSPDRVRRAGVSSFGFSGTNAHVILEEAPLSSTAEAAARRTLHCIPISARSDAALRALAGRTADAIEKMPADVDAADLAYACGAGRTHHAERVAITAESSKAIVRALAALSRGEPDEAMVRGTANPARVPEVVFVFTGQGAQYPGMARTLYDTSPVFRHVIDRSDSILGSDSNGRTLKSVLWPTAAGDTLVHETMWTQPALFAVEYGVCEVWRASGITPAAVIGHSVGEYVAACVAGALEFEDGLRLIAERGRLMHALPAGGSMAAIFARESDVAAAIAPFADRLAIAAVNAAENVVISGAADAVDSVLRQFEQRGVRGHKLFISIAAHSPLMAPALDAMSLAAGRIAMKPPRIPVAWNLTGGRPLPGNGAPDAGYWRRHLREPVRFADGIARLHSEGFTTFLEVGPHPTLTALARQTLPETGVRLLHSLRREHDDWSQMLATLGELYVAGVRVDWQGATGPYARRAPELPTYPFERKTYWVETPREGRRPTSRRSVAPLRGTRLDAAIPIFETALSTKSLGYLDQHRVHGAALVAGPVLMELAQAAAASELGNGQRAICDFAIEAPLVLTERDRTVQVHLDTTADRGVAFSIHSRDGDETGWMRHATGALRPADQREETPAEALSNVRRRLGEERAGGDHYRVLASLGIELGPLFRTIESYRRSGGEVLARLTLPKACASDAVQWAHPVLVDGVLQTCGLALLGVKPADDDDLYLFTGIDRIELGAQLPDDILCHARLEPQSDARSAQWRAEGVLLAEDGRVLGKIAGVRLQRSSRRALARLAATAGGSEPAGLFYRLDWQEAPIPQRAGLHLPHPSQLADGVQETFIAHAAASGLSIYDDLLPALDRLSAGLVANALAKLGFEWRAGRDFEATAERGKLGILDRYARLFERFLAILAEDGLVARAGRSWRVARMPERIDARGDPFAALLARFRETDAELRILQRCGSELSGVLTGTTDPVGLLFPGGSLAEARKLYVEAPFARTYSGAIADALRTAAAALPKGARLRVLEVGAGTGGTTSHVLPRLDASTTEYTFTDISPLFLERAREQFAAYPFVRYAMLDIERDPTQQGLPQHGFDVVIASNVLHATADLAQSLAHVQRVMAPGGLLLLLEGTRPERWVDLTFGLTEGWWRYTDVSLRADYPLIDRTAWSDLLTGAGYADPIMLPRHPDAMRGTAQQSLIMARLPRPARDFTIVGDGEFGTELARRLRARGDRVATCAPGEINETTELKGDVVYLGAMSLAKLEPQFASGAQVSRSLACEIPLRLMQGVIAAPGAKRLYLASRGACSTDATERASRWQAPILGLGRVFALEQPGRWGGIIDLPKAGGSDEVDLLLQSLDADDAEDQTCWRDGRRLAGRLAADDPPDAAAGLRLRADATYLVTGGFGGLGLVVGKWLADNGARHIGLMGRKPDPGNPAIRAMEAAGARVFPIACDVTNASELEAALGQLSAVAPQVAGIVHASADLSSAPIATMTSDQMRRMLKPKVEGTVNLERIAQRLAVDFLVLFSSTTALIGAAGLGHYAAANAFLDAVAEDQDGMRGKVISINWGTWEVMRLASADAQQSYREGGLVPIPIADALDAMRDCIAARRARAIVARVDWPALKALHEARRVRPLLSNLGLRVEATTTQTGSPAAVGAPKLPQMLAALPEAAHRDQIISFVATEVAGVLKREDPAGIPHETGLFELGMDSLMSVELKRRLERGAGRPLPSTLTFNYPSISALATFLHAELQTHGAPKKIVVPVSDTRLPATASEGLDQLSEDEIEARLLARLERIK